MAAERAVIASQVGVAPGSLGLPLQHFSDKIVVKLRLTADEEGPWLLIGRVILRNLDGDPQDAHAKLVHRQDVVLEDAGIRVLPNAEVCVVVRAGFVLGGDDIVTLQCNTFQGRARLGSIVAWKVDHIAFQ